ncbi:hypothetical protein [Sphingomonas agri]|uniref:hypothetical protein n=1 Tax=Sphingomonas agri TaxID=1813878 RepID=UPI00311E8D25
MPDWLPPLILLEQFNGDWNAYLAAIYAKFQQDFLGHRPPFQGRRMGLKRQPIEEGKEATFWHFVSTGNVEADRIIEPRRCERIAWPRAIIDHCTDPAIKMWSEERKDSVNIHLWCEEAEYLVVLADRGEFVLPWTGYPVEREHQREKLNRRWEEFGGP